MSVTENLNQIPEWLVNDPLLKDKEVEIHDKLHAQIANAGVSKENLLNNPRLKLFPIIENRYKFRLGGRVLDVGCGSGYFSAWLALNREPEIVYALESSPAAVNTLIPRSLDACGVKKGLVLPVQGSFNFIPKSDYFDYVVAMGALHHSSDLFTTLKEIHKSLKPGGYLIAQEPTLDDSTTNKRYKEIYQSRVGHNDHFFRNCEYKTALNFVGFEIICYDYFNDFVEPQSLNFRQMLGKVKVRIKNIITRQHRNASAININAERRVIVARKPEDSIAIPHVWKDLH
jgi:SAM-dependent methyltransferase